MELYKIKPDVILQNFNEEYYIIDIVDEKTFRINKEGYMILSQIKESKKNAKQIFKDLGGKIDNANDINIIIEYLTKIKDKYNILEQN